MPYADVNDQRIYFEDTRGDGPSVILGHRFLMDHTMFAPQVEALVGDYRVITWDERGFGQTERDGKPFSYWDSASDCLREPFTCLHGREEITAFLAALPA